jgi:hypothetical protein
MMKTWIAMLGMTALAAIALGLMATAPTCVVAATDAEAATLFGGCVDPDTSADPVVCGENGEGNCTKTTGTSKYLTNGSGKDVDINCGANSCGTVPMTSGTCDG